MSASQPDRDQFDALLEDAEAGDPGAVDELEEFVRVHADQFAHLGDVGRLVERHLIDSLSSRSALLRATLPQLLGRLRANLGDAGDDPLVGLVVQAVVNNWLHFQSVHVASVQPRRRLASEDYWSKRLSRSQERFESAVRLLEELQN